MEDNDMMPLICIRCKKDIPLTVKTFEEVSYTHYSYCEECLRKGLKALKAWDLLYKRIYDHHYEILKMEEGEVKRAKLSLSNWVLDLMTGELDYDYVPDINVGKIESDDCISRQAVGYYIQSYIHEIITESGTDKNEHTNSILRAILNGIKTMPSVTPKAKMGRWIDIQYFKADDTYYRPKCPFCGIEPKEYSNYCPNCGARMEEE